MKSTKQNNVQYVNTLRFIFLLNTSIIILLQYVMYKYKHFNLNYTLIIYFHDLGTATII